jgi:integrase
VDVIDLGPHGPSRAQKGAMDTRTDTKPGHWATTPRAPGDYTPAARSRFGRGFGYHRGGAPPMQSRYRLTRRGCRGDTFYCVDTRTGQRTSLRTSDRTAALRLVHGRNEADRQPMLNLQMAKVYLAGTHRDLMTRTWRQAMDTIIELKQGANRERWLTFLHSKAIAELLPKVIVETDAGVLLRALQRGKVTTNVYLRRLHNFCLDMNWLLAPLIPKRQWPAVHYKEKRAVTREEHQKIIAAEFNPERRAFYELCWHLGGSQGDVARLVAEDVDWEQATVSFVRKKTGVPVLVHLGADSLNVFKDLPSEGMLFPCLAPLRASDRANLFRDGCRRAGVQGVTLHSYRYSWAERAKTAGYPERFAQEALGHNSKAVHRAYAKHALMKLPSLEDYERAASMKVGSGQGGTG